MKGIRIYCEGGGDGRASREMLTKGFREFLKEVVALAREKKLHFDVFACGSRNDAYEKFKISLQTYQDSLNVLLVDAEAPVTETSWIQPWVHLKQQDHWDDLGCSDQQCYLMVQAMEAWFFADPEALAKFYGQKFQAKDFLKISSIEIIEKSRLEPMLKKATKKTSKGEYHKIQHGAKLLGLIAPLKVRQKSRHCNRLFDTLSSLMG